MGVAALSGPVEPEKLAAGVESLRRLGFEPVLAGNVLSRRGFLAGSDEERLAAFHELAADPGLRAIFFTRGGYGAMRILPALDWDLLARHPRAWVGYSDLTPFLMGVVRRLGLVSFHGPLVAGELADAVGDRHRAGFGECFETGREGSHGISLVGSGRARCGRARRSGRGAARTRRKRNGPRASRPPVRRWSA